MGLCDDEYRAKRSRQQQVEVRSVRVVCCQLSRGSTCIANLQSVPSCFELVPHLFASFGKRRPQRCVVEVV